MDTIFQMESVPLTYVTTTASSVNRQPMEHPLVLIVGLGSTPTLPELACHVFPTAEYAQGSKVLFA